MTERAPTPRQSKRKAELLAASAELFQEFGYHNVSMDDIAATVGITGPALYRHFPNKHDVLVQALNTQVASVERVPQHVLDQGFGTDEQLQRFLDDLATLVLDVDEVLLWKREQAHLREEEREAFRRRVRKVRDQTVDIIRGWRPEIAAADAEMLAWVVLSIYSNTQEYRSRMDRRDLAQLLPRMARAVLTCDLAGAPATARRARPDNGFTPVGRRERVLDAAAQLFDLHGYRAVSVEDIAEASQTAIATVYQLVSSKANLLHAVLARGGEGTSFLTSHRLAFAADAAASLDVIVDTYIELACGPHGRLLNILDFDLPYLDNDARHALRRSQREYVQEWIRALSLVRTGLTGDEARARVHTAIGVIGETTRVAGLRTRCNLQGEIHMIASAILNS